MNSSTLSNFKNRKIIAIDFDGTLVKDAYPSIGKPMPFAFDTLKKLQAEGHVLILWTYRSGKALNEAVDHVKTELMPDFDFDAFNHEFDEEGGEGGEGGYSGGYSQPVAAPVAAVETIASPVDEAPIAEPEADSASSTSSTPSTFEGDNGSSEEVDKW